MMLKENRLLDEIEFLEVLAGKDLKQVNGGILLDFCASIRDIDLERIRAILKNEPIFYKPGERRSNFGRNGNLP